MYNNLEANISATLTEEMNEAILDVCAKQGTDRSTLVKVALANLLLDMKKSENLSKGGWQI
jgi:hypothetical protein